MAIAFQCGCGKAYRLKPELAGKRVKCASCGKVLQVPTPEPQFDDLKLLADDPFAALTPLQNALPATEPGLASPLQSLSGPALGNPLSGTDGNRSLASVPWWVWLAAGGAAIAVMVVMGIIVAASMGGNSQGSLTATAANARSTPPAPPTLEPPARLAPSSPPPAQKSPSQLDWRTFRSQHGGYSVDFPGQPQHREDERNSPQGKMTIHTDMVASSSIGVFSVAYMNNPQRVSDPEKQLAYYARNAAAGTAAGSGGKIIETRNIQVRGVASKLYVIKGVRDDVSFEMQVVFILTPDRFYHVGWGGTDEIAPESDIARFMESFRTEST